MSARKSEARKLAKIAVADGDARLRRELVARLRADFTLLEVENFTDLHHLLEEERPELLLLDFSLPAGGVRQSLGLLQDLSESDLDTVVIALSDDNRKATALKAMGAGAYDYFPKPLDLDVLRTIIDRAIEKLFIERENRLLRQEVERKDSMGNLIGSTEVMHDLFDSIRRVARGATTVVIRGESGTGKELVANAIHVLSQRRHRPFVSVNCAALPETLMEAELFGYEKGAFTGATTTKEGRFELAHQGTLFLDEIGTLSPALQTKLLRVLEERTLVRLGGKKSIRVDFRLLTATNDNLEELVERGRFREDLYYRIHVVPLVVPPLRERVEDIPLLIDYFVQVYCAANHLPRKRVDDEALAVLKGYRWPGNVRELENVVQRMVLMTDDNLITLKNVPREVAQAVGPALKQGWAGLPPQGIRLEEEVAAYERGLLESALRQAGGVKAQAARLLGLNKDRMKYLCRKYKL